MRHLPVIAALLVLSIPATAQTVKIMPLGDSLTNGYGAPGGYRQPLYNMLVAGGMTPTFVGTETANPGPTLPCPSHNGFNGAVIGPVVAPGRVVISQFLNYWMFLAGSDLKYVLLLLGTNDVDLSLDVPGIPSRLNGLVNQCYAANPNVTIILGTLPKMNKPGCDPVVQSVNSAILGPGGIVQTQSAAGRKIIGVDFYNGVSTGNFFDSLHPNAAGYQQMARLWATALLGRTRARSAPSTDVAP